MTLNASLNLARQAISNNQFGLNIITNNVTNMNTIGYSRQSAQYSSRSGYNTTNYASSNQFIIGGGTKIDSITRNRDQFVDNHFREQTAGTGFYSQIGSMTSVVESTMNELGEKGLQKALTDFYAAADALSGDPSNQGYRISYAAALQNVSDKFNQMSSTLNTGLKENVGVLGDPASFAGSKVSTTVDDLNSKLSQLADLNQQILQNSSTKGPANELMDQRDLLLDDISTIIPVNITTNENNTVSVSFNNMTLVDGNKQYLKFNAVQGVDADKPAIIQLSNMDTPPQIIKNDITDSVDSGILGAILSTAGTRNVDGLNFTSVLNQLDHLAAAFAERVNEIQTGVNGLSTPMCLDENGKLVDSTTNLFETSDGTGVFTASNIRFNQAVTDNPNLIAAARVTKEAGTGAYDPDNIGNGLNMDLVLGMKTEKLPIEAGTPNKTLNEYLTTMTSSVGNRLTNINNKAKSQNDVMTQIDNQRNAMYGVNLDEEITDLIKFQRAYEAASRVFNVTSQMMQILTSLGQ